MTRHQVVGSFFIALVSGVAVLFWATGRGTGALPAAGFVAASGLGLVFVAITMRYNMPTVEPRALFARKVAEDDGFAGRQAILMRVFMTSGAMLVGAAAVTAIAVTVF